MSFRGCCIVCIILFSRFLLFNFLSRVYRIGNKLVLLNNFNYDYMAKKGFWMEFKDFAMRGNVIDMAVGVIVGGAFGKIVSSLVNDIIMPLVGALIGGFNFTDLKLTIAGTRDAVTVNYGNFLQVLVDFLIIAFSIFVVIRLITKATEAMKKQLEHNEPELQKPAPEPADITLLKEIRDILKKQQMDK